MSDPCGCDESKRLQSELEVARMRLDNGIKVMNARQAHSREGLAQLLVKIDAAIGQLREGCADEDDCGEWAANIVEGILK